VSKGGERVKEVRWLLRGLEWGGEAVEKGGSGAGRGGNKKSPGKIGYISFFSLILRPQIVSSYKHRWFGSFCRIYYRGGGDVNTKN